MLNYLRLGKKLYICHRIFKRYIETDRESSVCERKKYIKEIINNFNMPASKWKNKYRSKDRPNNSNLGLYQHKILDGLFGEKKRLKTYTLEKNYGHNKENKLSNKNKLKLNKEVCQVDLNEKVNNDNLSISQRKTIDNLDEGKKLEASTSVEKCIKENIQDKIGPKFISHLHKNEEKLSTTNGNLIFSQQNTINYLIKNRRELDASSLVENHITENNIPNFLTLKELSLWASKHGHSDKVQIFQKACAQFYPKLLKEEGYFEHYLCDALFQQGKHKEALVYLETVIKKYPHQIQVNEIANSIMKSVTGSNVSEENQEKAFELCKSIITFENEYEPAVVLWKFSFMSDQYHLQKLAHQLIAEHPNLFDENEDVLIRITEEAFHNNRDDQLQQIIQICMRLQGKEPLHGAVSSLLSLYCMMENVSAAHETLNFARQNEMLLTQHSLSQFVNLLHKKKKATPFSLLTYIYGFGKPILHTVKASEIPSIKFKF